MTSDSPALDAYRNHRVLVWVGAFFAAVIIALFIASFFFDDIIRARTQIAMNQKLKGYHVTLDHARQIRRKAYAGTSRAKCPRPSL